MKARFETFMIVCILSFLAVPLSGSAKKQDARHQLIEKIKASNEYYWGEGSAPSIEEANINALVELSRNIKVVLSNKVDAVENDLGLSISDKTGISSFTSLSNTEMIEISPEPNAVIFRYMKKEDLQKGIEDRERKITDMINLGQSLEQRGEIASCLKYYNWALALSKVHPHQIMIDVKGKETTAKEWLHAHIGVVLNTIKVTVDNVEDRGEDMIDRYAVTLRFDYNGDPVSDLDFAYHDGFKVNRNHRAKNGVCTVDFPELPEKNMDLFYYYRYEKEGANHDDELKSYYASFKTDEFPQAEVKIPVSGNSAKKFKVQKTKNEPAVASSTSTASSVAAALEQKHRTLISQEPVGKDLHRLISDRIVEIEKSLQMKDPASVKSLFTTDGWQLFMSMLGSAQSYNVVKSKDGKRDYNVRQSGRFLEGRGIPISLKYRGGHRENETIVFRFTGDGLCESVAYALTDRAEEDIFKQNKWDLDARYAILRFMEDYQTAFSLKRLGYIESIFSDDAIIITGKKTGRGNVRKTGDGKFIDLSSEYSFKRQSKDEYIDNLRRDFTNKNYIKLTFEDNEIMHQSSNLDIAQNIYWIEIKQFYSSSGYNDVGYLSLQIDMSSEDPKIKVRTWQPGKLPLQELMRRFGYQ